MKDLVILVSDRQMRAVVTAILGRQRALGVRSISFDVHTHPEHDPGCRVAGVEFLAIFTKRYHHAILMFDWEGCEEPRLHAPDLRAELGNSLTSSGWEDRATAIIIEPELENWLWVGSSLLPRLMGWGGDHSRLQAWLSQQGFIEPGRPKPYPPKEAMEAALREKRKSRTSALYSELAQKASFKNCSDQAFLTFRDTLKEWFQ